ncbi:leucine-rich repeat flightless-interacting protein 1 [Cololabis saira]|uniref:leucine-rich repeat flightless-interacting protein 1 n=1 Tax=Cololabis saira TaxID=129043 RepID=UPI002AD1FF9C|nr:leucine-rich repeat flightless-interacting protein 1 [Cololabis saira]
MHSNTLDSSGSPKKRSFSRGLSEDESLRNIIKETESSARRPTRSDSRAGTLKRRTGSQQSDPELFMGLPEMLELQASYDEAVQEVHGLEVEREALLFQVDVLQDTLEGVEELLAEAQREAGHATLELERERAAKKKLESLVGSLMQEVERLKEERNNKAPAPENMSNETRQEQINNDAPEVMKVTQREEKELCSTENSIGGLAAAEDGGPSEGPEDAGGVLTKLQRTGSQPLTHLPSLALDNPPSVDGVLRRPYERHTRAGRDPSPDSHDSDSVSAYEDASAETPEQDAIFTGDDELPDDVDNRNGSENEDPRDPEACVLS